MNFLDCYTAITFLVLISNAEAQTCTTLGVVCSSDCGKVVVCTTVGADPLIVQEDCSGATSNPSYCQETPSGPTCGAQLPKCSSSQSSVNIICGSIGRFPNPLKQTTSVTCTEVGKAPTETCYCPVTQTVDVSNPILQCIEGTPGTPADCSQSTNEFVAIGEIFAYFCANPTTVYVTFKGPNTRSVSKPLFVDNRSIGTCEPSSNIPTGTPPTPTPSVTPTGTSPTPTPTPSVTPTPTPPVTPTATPPPISPAVKCQRRLEHIADPANCYRYYVCDRFLEPHLFTCPPGTRYGPIAKACVAGRC